MGLGVEESRSIESFATYPTNPSVLRESGVVALKFVQTRLDADGSSMKDEVAARDAAWTLHGRPKQTQACVCEWCF
jgi:hypothetical protein